MRKWLKGVFEKDKYGSSLVGGREKEKGKGNLEEMWNFVKENRCF